LGRVGSRQSCACKRIQVACVSCLSLRLEGIEKALRAVSCIGWSDAFTVALDMFRVYVLIYLKLIE
jgi:hypothetical protein